MYAKSVLKAMLGEATTGVLPDELIPVDRIMQRWAVANGNGLPTGEWDDNPKARPPPLDDDTCIIVDEIVLKCPPKTKRIIVSWYCRPLPTKLIARGLKMSPRNLEKAWGLSLNFLRFKFENTKHLTLLRLLRIRAI